MMQRTTLQTVARRRISAICTQPAGRAFSSSAFCFEEDSKTRPATAASDAEEPISAAPSRPGPRVPKASSLGDIQLREPPTLSHPNLPPINIHVAASENFKIRPASAPGRNFRPDLMSWASEDLGGARVSLSQRHAQRRVQALDSAGALPTSFGPLLSPGEPQLLPIPDSTDAAYSPVPAPGIWVRAKTAAELRKEEYVRMRAETDKRREEGRLRAVERREEAERMKRLHEIRRLEMAKNAERREEAAKAAQAREMEQKERMREEMEARHRAAQEQIELTRIEREEEERRIQAAIAKSIAPVSSGPSVPTPQVVREELEKLMAAQSLSIEDAGTTVDPSAISTPQDQKLPVQIDSLLATRAQNLKDRAGDYSTYLPSHYGVGRAPGQERALGPVAYAQLVLAKSRGAPLNKRREAVQIVERFVNSKEMRAEA